MRSSRSRVSSSIGAFPRPPLWRHPRTYVLALTVTCLSFVGCGGNGGDEGSADRDSFRDAYDAIRPGPPLDNVQFAQIVNLAEDTCADPRDTFLLTYSMLQGPSAEGFRLSVEEFCPERLNDLERYDKAFPSG
jgi:hypothetical protein